MSSERWALAPWPCRRLFWKLPSKKWRPIVCAGSAPPRDAEPPIAAVARSLRLDRSLSTGALVCARPRFQYCCPREPEIGEACTQRQQSRAGLLWTHTRSSSKCKRRIYCTCATCIRGSFGSGRRMEGSAFGCPEDGGLVGRPSQVASLGLKMCVSTELAITAVFERANPFPLVSKESAFS